MAPESFNKDQQWLYSSAALMKSTAAAPRSSSTGQKNCEENLFVSPLNIRVFLFHIKACLDGCGLNSMANK